MLRLLFGVRIYVYCEFIRKVFHACPRVAVKVHARTDDEASRALLFEEISCISKQILLKECYRKLGSDANGELQATSLENYEQLGLGKKFRPFCTMGCCVAF